MIFTVLLEKAIHQDIGMENIPLIEAKASIDLYSIESVRESIDKDGEVEDFCCLVTLRSGSQHCVKLPFDDMAELHKRILKR